MLSLIRFMAITWTAVASMVTLLAGVPVHQMRSRIGLPLLAKPRQRYTGRSCMVREMDLVQLPRTGGSILCLQPQDQGEVLTL